MGVAGLLKMISSCVHEVELSAYRGRKIAVDASCWLHRGTFACPIELAAGENYILDICIGQGAGSTIGDLDHAPEGVEALTINGNGATITQTCEDRVLEHRTDGLLTLDDVTITGGTVTLRSGGQIFSRTSSNGDGGDLVVDVDAIAIDGVSDQEVNGRRPPSGIFALILSSTS